MDKNSIVLIEQEMVKAMLNSDVTTLDKLIHEDLLFTIPSGHTITKTMDLASHSSGEMKISEISTSEQEINLIGDNAIVSVLVEMKGKYMDNSLDGNYKTIRVWKQSQNSWQIIAGSTIQL
ncbi:MAG: DUF4440 domain-containing protein [Bacteroidetes bacterium]|nr:MAG: DUF4440 domain-containing protein [Bacteroidota bacterium]